MIRFSSLLLLVCIFLLPSFVFGEEQQECKLVTLHNRIRVHNKLPPFQQNEHLMRYAQWHTGRMVDGRGLQHSNVGFLLRWYSTAGENIAQGQQTELEVTNSWMSSSGHRSNILNRRFVNIGCCHRKNFWCVVFAGKRSDK